MNHVKQRARIFHGAIMVLITAGLWGGPWPCAAADPFSVPALTSPPNDMHLVGKLVWLDLETTDLPGAKSFYGALFGWNYRDYRSDGVDYTVALAEGKPVAGMVRRQILNDAQARSAWLPFFSVANLPNAFARALEAHAQVRSEPENLPLRGRQARLLDPQGAAFALVMSSSGDPLDDPPPRALGTWGSPSLLARDPGRDAVFYQGLFGYSMLGEPTVRDFDRIRLSVGAHERATVRRLPGGVNAPHPQWISFVRVINTADTVRQALNLGGSTILDASRDGDGAVTAILGDPTGAAFGVAQSFP
jgi:predicted enzyme related to lactoylglutathione lyase